ncbi:hypothetical protein B0H19DRAFT_1062421 [Mycena capillaripes]|nr:hypothetical protein B0H19DRAFT_1062421 [Mycena capillaripes]
MPIPGKPNVSQPPAGDRRRTRDKDLKTVVRGIVGTCSGRGMTMTLLTLCREETSPIAVNPILQRMHHGIAARKGCEGDNTLSDAKYGRKIRTHTLPTNAHIGYVVPSDHPPPQVQVLEQLLLAAAAKARASLEKAIKRPINTVVPLAEQVNSPALKTTSHSEAQNDDARHPERADRPDRVPATGSRHAWVRKDDNGKADREESSLMYTLYVRNERSSGVMLTASRKPEIGRVASMESSVKGKNALR